jgi:hypothetical protein
MARSAMLWAPLALVAALTHLVAADIEFVSPKAGAKLTGGQSIVIEWKESGDSPAITDLTTYELWICAGGNEETTIVRADSLNAQSGLGCAQSINVEC